MKIRILGTLIILLITLYGCKSTQIKSNSFGDFPLHELILANRATEIRKYFESGNSTTYFKKGWTPLLFATQLGHKEIVEILIRHGAKVNNTSYPDHISALHLASAKGYYLIVQILLNNGAKIDHQDSKLRSTPLMRAAVNGHKKVVQLLIDRGALLNVRGNRGESALFLAISAEETGIAKLLIERGANKIRPDIYGVTPLQKAIKLNNKKLITLLEK